MSPSGTGHVTVTMPTLDPGVRPEVTVIDGTSLGLVATSRSGEQVELPAGKYVVCATMPTGERSLGVVEVAAGGSEEVELTPEATAAVYTDAAPPPPPVVPLPPPSAPPSAGPSLESLGAGAEPPPAPESRGARAEPPPAPVAEAAWLVRFFSLGQDRSSEPVDPPVDVENVADGSVELEVQAYGDGRMFAQLALPGQIPLNVALPIAGPTISQSCRLTVSVLDGKLEAAVALVGNPRVDAVARYLSTGNVQEAASLSADFEQLLEQKMSDPFGAALGAYALLRLGDLSRLHHWPRNLAQYFPWLPDGATIAGEEAAREGDHATAVSFFSEAAGRGLPVFADGFSMLVSRLREYARAEKPPKGVSKELHKEMRAQNERLLPLTPFTHFARISFAILGMNLDDPAGSQQPVESAAAGEGWKRVDADAKQLVAAEG